MFSSQTVRIFYRFPYFRKSDRKWNRTYAEYRKVNDGAYQQCLVNLSSKVCNEVKISYIISALCLWYSILL
jgi:hypothetical protein